VCFELEANKEKRPANWKSVLWRGTGPLTSEGEIEMLEDKYNLVINQLHSILNPIPQAPPLT
jgi:hypothetical protein